MSLKCIVGLGNPGDKYLQTRHNIGFRVLDTLAERAGQKFQIESKWESRTCKLGDILMVQPLTYMNESGRAISSLARFFRWDPEEILVVFDDISLPLGHLRFRMNGGHGGHNGVRSLLAHLPSDRFARLLPRLRENWWKTRLQEPPMLFSLPPPADSKSPLTSSILELPKNQNHKRNQMNRKYEGMIVLNTQGTESSVDDLVSTVSKELEEEGAKLDEVKQLGRKKFAYNARKLDGGLYVNYVFEAEGDAIDKIQARLKLNHSVHLQHFQRRA